MNKALSILVVLLACDCLRAQDRGLEIIRSKGEGQGQHKVALVIGNGDYKFSPLRNPVTDAKDMAQALTSLGFEVIGKTDLNQNEMKQAIRAFGGRIRQGGIGLFYYAGHAVQVEGRNYLVPVGAEVTSEHEVEYEAVDVGFLLSQMETAHNELNIVILDACRNNPFIRKFRSINNGLASINAPSGTLIAYATAPGSVASDGEGKNGLYTQELLKAMRETGLKIEDLFKRVRSQLQKVTGGKQVPWESSSLVGDFYFSGRSNADPPPIRSDNRVDDKGGGAALRTDSRQSPPEGGTNRSSLSSTAAKVFITEGDAQAKQKHWREAEIEYRQAVDLDSNDARVRVKLGDVLSQQLKWAEAEVQYAVGVRLDPNNKAYQDRLSLARGRNK